MARAFLIDTDTASDDAVALIMALGAPDVRVVATTILLLEFVWLKNGKRTLGEYFQRERRIGLVFRQI